MEILLAIVVVSIIGFGGWFIFTTRTEKDTPVAETASSDLCENAVTGQESWKKAVSSGRSFSMCVAGGWTLVSDTESELFRVLPPFTISNTQDSKIEEKTIGGGDGTYDLFEVFKAESSYQGWTDENNSTVTEFTSNDGTKGSKYYTKWDVVGDGIGPVQGEEDYEYLFEKNGKYIHAIYTIMPDTTSEIESIEKVLKPLVSN